MGTIERVKKWVQKNGIPFEVDFGVGDHYEEFIRSVDILDVLASIETERCLWILDDFNDGTSKCGRYVHYDLSSGPCFCAYCGKRIEVKEADNG